MKTLKRLTAWIIMLAMMFSLLQVNMIDAWAAEGTNINEAFYLKYDFSKEESGRSVEVKHNIDTTGKTLDYEWYVSTSAVDYSESSDYSSLTNGYTARTGNTDKYTFNSPMSRNSDIDKYVFSVIKVTDNENGNIQYYRTSCNKKVNRLYDDDHMNISSVSYSGEAQFGFSTNIEFNIEGQSLGYSGSKPGDTLRVVHTINEDIKQEVENEGYYISYQWYESYGSVAAPYNPKTDTSADSKIIEGATESTYTIQEDDVGKIFGVHIRIDGAIVGNAAVDSGRVHNIKDINISKDGNNVNVNIVPYKNRNTIVEGNWFKTKNIEDWFKNPNQIYNDNYTGAYFLGNMEELNLKTNNNTTYDISGETGDYGYIGLLVKERVYNFDTEGEYWEASKDSNYDTYKYVVYTTLNQSKEIKSAELSTKENTIEVGETISVESVTVTDNKTGQDETITEGLEDKFSFQWKREDETGTKTDILNETKISYKTTVEDLSSKNILAEVTPKTDEYTGSAQTPEINVITSDPVFTLSITSNTDPTKPGSVLTAKVLKDEEEVTPDKGGDWDYIWKNEDGDVLQEGGKTYTAKTEDVGKKVYCEIVELNNLKSNEILVYNDENANKYLIKSGEMSYTTNKNGGWDVFVDKIVAEKKDGSETVNIPTDSTAWNGFTYQFYIGDELIGTPANPFISVSADKDISKLKIVITGKDTMASDGRVYIDSIELTTSPVTEDELVVKDNEKPDTPNPSTTKPGNTLVAEFNTDEAGIEPEQIIYTWYVRGNDGTDDEEIGNSKELSVLDELAGKKVYVVLTYPGKDEWNRTSSLITVKANTEETSKGECNVIVTQGQSFTVTIPAFVSLNGDKNKANEASFKTVVIADISGSDSITVEPAVTSFKMTERGGIKKALTATITGDKSVSSSWRYAYDEDDCNEAAFESGIERVHKISVAKLSAGKWTGTFNWNITTTGNKIKDSQEYVKYRTYESTDNGLEYIEGSEVKVPDSAENTPWE